MSNMSKDQMNFEAQPIPLTVIANSLTNTMNSVTEQIAAAQGNPALQKELAKLLTQVQEAQSQMYNAAAEQLQSYNQQAQNNAINLMYYEQALELNKLSLSMCNGQPVTRGRNPVTSEGFNNMDGGFYGLGNYNSVNNATLDQSAYERLFDLNMYYVNKYDNMNIILRTLCIMLGVVVVLALLGRVGVLPDALLKLTVGIMILTIIIYAVYNIIDMSNRSLFTFNDYIWSRDTTSLPKIR